MHSSQLPDRWSKTEPELAEHHGVPGPWPRMQRGDLYKRQRPVVVAAAAAKAVISPYDIVAPGAKASPVFLRTQDGELSKAGRLVLRHRGANP